MTRASHQGHKIRVPLANLPPGRRARLSDIGDGIDPLQREQLAAYGLVAGGELQVLQQQPMTVIFADEMELALEPVVARDIWVEPMN